MRIEVDIYSGRPNPVFEVEDARAAEILAGAAPGRDFVQDDAPVGQLGYRGVLLQSRGEPLLESYQKGVTRIAAPSRDSRIGRELALALLEAGQPVGDREGAEPLMEAAVRDEKHFLAAQIAGEGAASNELLTEGGDAKAFQAPAFMVPCANETLPFDPAFWNDPLHVRRNNCYAFATNRRTDTFPQPGNASGAPIRSLTCADVGRASLSDGLHWQGNCFGDAEKPRLLVALVIWPGRDYHWYRLQDNGMWAHKPGQTPAKNVDDSGLPITDPSTCNRGPYTDFCGFMLSPNSVRVA